MSKETMKDPKSTALDYFYSILDAPPDSTWDMVQQRYRTLAMRYHPDRNPHDPDCSNHFRRITAAYEAVKELMNLPAISPYSFDFRISNLKRVSYGSIKAFYDVEFPFGLIKGFKLIQQPGQRMWSTPPDQPYTTKEGKKAYARIVELDKDLMGAIEYEAVRLFKNDAGY